MVNLSPILGVLTILGVAAAQPYEPVPYEANTIDPVPYEAKTIDPYPYEAYTIDPVPYEATETQDQVLTYGNYTYTVYAKSLADDEPIVEMDEEMRMEYARIHPDILEDSRLTTTGLLKKYGYPYQIHRIVTKDGYTLEMHRIPGSPLSPPRHGKRVCFLMHGLLDSSAGWILMGPHHGLGYWLADLGYDVWLGNARGNRYSRHHIRYNPDGNRSNRRSFWNFSWHQIGVIDLPAKIEYISAVTGQHQMHYIGHSQGTTAYFVMASVLPHYNRRIKSMNALAPIAYMSNIRSPFVRLATTFLPLLDAATTVLGMYEFLPNSEMMNVLGETQCRDGAWLQGMCSNVLFLIGGFNSEQMNDTMLPVILGHTPAGASTDQMVHYGQSIRSARFRQFDHGPISNMFEYNSITPPAYNLRNVDSPVALHYSLNDWLAEPIDVQQLMRELGNMQGGFITSDPRFNHFDFLWAIDVRRLVYDQVLAVMRRFE